MKRTLRHFDKRDVLEDIRNARQWYNKQSLLSRRQRQMCIRDS